MGVTFSIFKMAAVRHLGFFKVRILTVGRAERANLRHLAKFRADRSNRCGDMTIYLFFNMAAIRHLGFVVRVLGPSMKGVWWHLSVVKI